MDYTQSGSDILLKQPDFGLDDTLDCGQAFRWEKIDKKTYSGAFLNNKLTISEEPENGVKAHCYNACLLALLCADRIYGIGMIRISALGVIHPYFKKICPARKLEIIG